jgi:hypothetical protein
MRRIFTGRWKEPRPKLVKGEIRRRYAPNRRLVEWEKAVNVVIE